MWLVFGVALYLILLSPLNFFPRGFSPGLGEEASLLGLLRKHYLVALGASTVLHGNAGRRHGHLWSVTCS